VRVGPAQAHVVVRLTRKFQGKEVRKVTVVSLKRSGGEWKVFPSAWQELTQANWPGQPGQVVGNPGAAAPEK
jgi:hypothetical protein